MLALMIASMASSVVKRAFGFGSWHDIPRRCVATNMVSENTAFIALGSNVGRKAQNIHSAIVELRKIGSVVSTSFLYQSEPMYFTDQPSFLNGVCKLSTSLPAAELLNALKSIETAVGRQKTFANGPRALDLDIVFFNNDIVQLDNRLVVPHPRLHERSFVLKPLHDIDPAFVHPRLKRSVQSLLEEFHARNPNEKLLRVIPCVNRESNSTKYIHVNDGLPLIMGILNVTPDSFSDGGRYTQIDLAIQQAQRMISEGADIVDIGGESTRPNAVTVDVDDEIRRVVPVIREIRARGITTLLSIDTRKAAVAEAAILAGADIVNDVSAGSYDPQMFATIAQLQVPYIAMHMRGEPATMLSTENTSYENVTEEVSSELQSSLSELNQRLPRWLQIVDPGIGFAKGFDENKALLHPSALRAFKAKLQDRPLLVGLSRKRFLSKLSTNIAEASISVSRESSSNDESVPSSIDLGIDEYSRDLLTVGANCAAIAGGANILRVHNVRAAKLACGAYADLCK